MTVYLYLRTFALYLRPYSLTIPFLSESLTRFHSRSAPTISVLDYLKRIVRFANVEASSAHLLCPSKSEQSNG